MAGQKGQKATAELIMPKVEERALWHGATLTEGAEGAEEDDRSVRVVPEDVLPGYKALWDPEGGQAYAVVTEDYTLVRHEEVLVMANMTPEQRLVKAIFDDKEE